MAVNRWNLNPVRLPVPPRSHELHYIGLPGVSRHAARTLAGIEVRQSRSLPAAPAGNQFHPVTLPRNAAVLDVQSVVSLAFGRKQFPTRPDDLLEHRHPEDAPQTL